MEILKKSQNYFFNNYNKQIYHSMSVEKALKECVVVMAVMVVVVVVSGSQMALSGIKGSFLLRCGIKAHRPKTPAFLVMQIFVAYLIEFQI